MDRCFHINHLPLDNAIIFFKSLCARILLSFFIVLCLLGCDSTHTDESQIDNDKLLSPAPLTTLNTIDIQSLRASSEKTMQRYLLASLERFIDDKSIQEAIFSGQQKWMAYSEAHCKAENFIWTSVEQQNQQRMMCEIELIQLRSIALWRTFLNAKGSQHVSPKPRN